MEISCRPRIVWLSITDICNNRCHWCYGQNYEDSKMRIMDETKAGSILNLMKAIGVKKCIVIGGEPTLHSGLFNILSFAKDSGMRISLVSNGRKFSDFKNVQKIAKLSVDGFTLSIHGWSDQVYENLTGARNGFGEVIAAISLLQESNIRFNLNFVLNKYSENSIEEIIDFVESIKMNRVGFNLATPSVSKNAVKGDFVLSMEQYGRRVMDMYYECKRRNIHSSFLLTIPHCVFTEKELRELFESHSISCGCHLLRGTGVVFASDGSMAICNHLLDFKIADSDETEKILNSEEEFLRFWNSERMFEIRKKANCFRSSECRKCGHWQVCGGGCLVRWAYHDPTTFKYHSFNFEREVIINESAC